MAITKGIVAGGNYTFSAANQTVTFSSDYLGMSLSDITYITNITSGVATVIYDPFDPTKGGTLSGLVLTLAYNTVAMSDSDPLQIIVGFTPSTATPQNVSVAPNSQLDSQTELLQSIAESTDLLSKVVDRAEGIEVNIRDIDPPKRDVNNAQVVSDCIETTYTVPPNITFISPTIDTRGYQSTHVYINSGTTGVNSVTMLFSNDNVNFQTSPFFVQIGNQFPILSAGGLGTSGNIICYCLTIGRYFRLTFGNSVGQTRVTISLRSIVVPPTQQQITTIQNSTSGQSNSAGGTFSVTGITTTGPRIHGNTEIGYPVTVGGREAPNAVALAGVVRTLLTDPQGRHILGGDYDATRPRDPAFALGVSTQGAGPYGNAPIRGVGGRPNTMHGSQALLVEDIGQSEGDTTPTLLQQILVELKMLNQQINELPLTMNLGIKMQNEVGEYRQEEYNNHVNNQ